MGEQSRNRSALLLSLWPVDLQVGNSQHALSLPLTSMSSRRKPSASLPASKERLSPASPPPPSLPADFLPLGAEGSTPTHWW